MDFSERQRSEEDDALQGRDLRHQPAGRAEEAPKPGGLPSSRDGRQAWTALDVNKKMKEALGIEDLFKSQADLEDPVAIITAKSQNFWTRRQLSCICIIFLEAFFCFWDTMNVISERKPDDPYLKVYFLFAFICIVATTLSLIALKTSRFKRGPWVMASFLLQSFFFMLKITDIDKYATSIGDDVNYLAYGLVCLTTLMFNLVIIQQSMQLKGRKRALFVFAFVFVMFICDLVGKRQETDVILGQS